MVPTAPASQPTIQSEQIDEIVNIVFSRVALVDLDPHFPGSSASEQVIIVTSLRYLWLSLPHSTSTILICRGINI